MHPYIFSNSIHFLLWEAASQTKYCYSPKSSILTPKNFGLATPLVGMDLTSPIPSKPASGTKCWQCKPYQQWRSQLKCRGEGKCLTSDEKQYFVWHTASQKQKMNGVAKNLWGAWRPGYAYAYQHNIKMYWTACTMLTSARTHHATSVLKKNVNNSPCNLKLWKSSCHFIIRKSTLHVQFETSRCNKHFEMKLLPTSFIPTLLVSTQTRTFRTFGCGEVFKRILFIPFIFK